ncbi:lytic transglycosylase domain-containing protein [uncultured Tateyamaria sp.]|uniref:lytic transglycosylase domain-containing protein n=1 Tax=uncultured Tateyamaria sp. TaxID=455651 RepID=UPI002617D6DE|nr:lytic transglycosylase domain-containing protein [uncultured Tateyamaria sp.]
MKRDGFWAACLWVVAMALPAPASAAEPGTMCSTGAIGPRACIRPAHATFDICQHIQGASRRYMLNPGFFARLLWQESRFDPFALSPAGARGIAQFMPGTADLRGLRDSYNPAEAIERSAHYLGELQRRYGNPGLAAVAYNGGEARADGFVNGGPLARETIDYVRIITGHTAEQWRDDPPKSPDFRLDGAKPFLAACLAMAANRRVSRLGPPPPQWKTWGVQLGYGSTARAARSSFERQTRACSTVVSGETVDYIPVPSRIRGQRPYLMARISRPNRGDASQLCRALARAGCICRVYRNPR